MSAGWRALVFAAAVCVPVFADTPGAARVYQLPQTVYVGDRASLAVVLAADPAWFQAAENTAAIPPELFAGGSLADLIIHRCALERRAGRMELRLEFTAFRPGMFTLPPFVLLAGSPPRIASPGSDAAPDNAPLFDGLTIVVSSILEGGSEDLAGPAGALTMPGTFLLINGAVIALLAAALLAVWGKLFGRRFFAGVFERGRRRRLCASMARIIIRMKNEFERDAVFTPHLSRLSAELRGFLHSMTGLPCGAMAAEEFIHASPEGSGSDGDDNRLPGTAYSLFAKLEDALYSGRPVSRETAFVILAEAQAVVRVAAGTGAET